ncbi:MAG: hypothetical protein K2N94_15835, partial [Lachnospiraceae bacterium]|nr:hypothetical protein [Lachnospiraceae bacterium]
VWGLIAVFSFIMDIVLLQSVRFGEAELRKNAAGKRAGAGRRAKSEKGSRDEPQEFGQLSDITEDDIQQLLVSYRVSREHVPVVIDSFPEEKIRQSAAYLWKDRGYLQMLALSARPKNIAVPLKKVTGLTCRRGVEVNPLSEYEDLRRPSVVSLAYQEFLPTYTERQRAGGRKYYTKNLYVLAPGIELTNTSVRNLQKILPVPVTFDGLANENDSPYYQEARRMKLMLLDKILTPAEYKEKISAVLKVMTERTSKNAEFKGDLERMVRERLVTREVAAYFLENRKKQDRKK